jgi:polyisoprenoid-binding protein YceI
MKSIVRKVVAALIVLAFLVVAGPWVYINLIKDDAPDALSLEPAVTTTVGEAPPTTDATDGEWAVVADSVVGYRVKEILFGQDTEGVGRTSAVSGSMVIANNEVTSAEFTVDMTTIKNTDLEGEWAGKLEGHLNSDDFFGTATYPTAKFVSTSVRSLDAAGNYEVTGNLTVKKDTHPVTVKMNAVEKTGVVAATGKITIDRSKYDVRYGSTSFFEGLGDKAIYNDFDLEFSLVAKK